MLSVKEAEIRMSVSNQTARNDLRNLANSGFLEIIDLDCKTNGYCRRIDFDDLIIKQL